MADLNPPKLTLTKFSIEGCAPCRAMKKAGTLEKLVEKHPNVTLRDLICADKKGEALPGSTFAESLAISDVYGVASWPTLVFEDERGELARAEGAMRFAEVEDMYDRALDRAKLRSGDKSPLADYEAANAERAKNGGDDEEDDDDEEDEGEESDEG